MLGIGRVEAEVRIICDASSGACNPDELKRLLDLPHVQIRTKDSLHAKLYITGECAFIGSANASANGLGEEGREVANNIEAAAMITDPAFTRSALHWFNGLWNAPDTKQLSAENIKRIRDLWKLRRRHRPMPARKNTSLLYAVKANPEAFKNRDLRLIAYSGTASSKEAQAKFKSISSELYETSALQGYKKDYCLPYYEDYDDCDVSPGDYIMDFQVNVKTRRAKYWGLWRVRSEQAFHKTKCGRRLILLDLVSHYQNLKCPERDGKLLEKAIETHLTESGFKEDECGNMLDLNLDEAIRVLDL